MELRKTDAGVYPDLETLSLSTNPEFLELIQGARARQAEEGGLLSAEMRRRLRVRHEITSSAKRVVASSPAQRGRIEEGGFFKTPESE